MKIRTEQLRKDLKNYYGTAMLNVSPMAISELSKIEKASDDELVRLAEKIKFDITKYYS